MAMTLAQFPPEVQQAATHATLRAGQILFQQGEPTEAVFLLTSGRFRLVSFTESQVVIHYFVEAGELFAETALHYDHYGCTALADAPAQVVALPKRLFLQALRQSPDLSEAYLAHLTRRFQGVKNLLELRSIRAAGDRLLHYLRQRTQPPQRTLQLDRPLKYYASELGMTPEGFSRTLTRLAAAGAITRKQRSITLCEDW